MKLTIQLFTAGSWRDAMTLRFTDAQKGFLGGCHFAYLAEHLGNHLDDIDLPFANSVSARAPLSFTVFSPATWSHPGVHLRDLADYLGKGGLL